jgi:hypothetical protein
VNKNPAVVDPWPPDTGISPALPNEAEAAFPSHQGLNRYSPGKAESGSGWFWASSMCAGFFAYFYSIAVLSSVPVLILGIVLILFGMILLLTSVLKQSMVDESGRVTAAAEPAEESAVTVSATVHSAETIIATASVAAAEDRQTTAIPEDSSPREEIVASLH